jgi:hypothetical protein
MEGISREKEGITKIKIHGGDKNKRRKEDDDMR